MAMISIAEYAEKHGISAKAVQMKCRRGGFKTAQKIGRNWCIDESEPYTDLRVTSGKYKNWRKKS